MTDLSNQECRDLPGSLSNRGCYGNSIGQKFYLDTREDATCFLCHACGKEFDMEHENLHTISVQDRSAVVPICFACSLLRQEKENANG